jgi:hypothetical protein
LALVASWARVQRSNARAARTWAGVSTKACVAAATLESKPATLMGY